MVGINFYKKPIVTSFKKKFHNIALNFWNLNCHNINTSN